MDVKKLSYSEIVYGLYNLASNSAYPTDMRFRQLMAALNRLRSHRQNLSMDYHKLIDYDQNPLSFQQFERLLAQIQAYTGYITVGLEVPQNLLERCGVVKKDTTETDNTYINSNKQSNIAEILHYSDVLHRSNEFWGPGQFWLEYMDSLEQNMLSYYLGATLNVRNMLQLAIRNVKHMARVESLAREVGLEDYINSFRTFGVINPEKLLAALCRLGRQIKLLIAQRNLKATLNLTRYVCINHGNTKQATVENFRRGLAEHIRKFSMMHRERRKQSRKNAIAAAKVFNAASRRFEAIERSQKRPHVDYPLNSYGKDDIYSSGESRRSRLSGLIRQTEHCMAYLRNLIFGNENKTLSSTVDTEQNPSSLSAPSDDPESESTHADLAKAKEGYYSDMHFLREVVTKPSPSVGPERLRNYQISGLNWLVSLYNNKFNGILADEMGLGKTVQTIALLAYLKDMKGIRGPHIILAPLSTLRSTWLPEFHKWFSACRLCLYEGSKDWRKSLRSQWYEGSNVPSFDVLLTTDSFLLKDRCYLRKFRWEYLVVDEAHRMKDPNSKLIKAVDQGFMISRRLLLTGIPLQNNLQEILTFLNFLMPELFPDSEGFLQRISGTRLSENEERDDGRQLNLSREVELMVVDQLQKVFTPFMLRREKHEVADELPINHEYIICCPLTGIQTRLYQMLNSKPSSNNKMLQLRNVCNHPFLFCGESFACDESIVTSCGKFVILDMILERLFSVGHRVLILSQMTSLLDILEVYLNFRCYKYLRLDGTIPSGERKERLELFNAENSEYFCFILSAKTGALGLNFQSVNTIITYESDWNPQNYMQVQSMVQRIRKESQILSLRFVTPNTVEENLLRSIGVKLNRDVPAAKNDPQQGSIEDVNKSEQMRDILKINIPCVGEYGIRSVEQLNEILARCDSGKHLFQPYPLKRLISKIHSMLKEPVVPPFMLEGMIFSKKIRLDEETIEELRISNEHWQEICDGYDVWSSSPTSECLEKIKTLSRLCCGDTSKELHPITNLPLEYPTERVVGAEKFLECLSQVPNLDEQQKRIKALNNIIENALKTVIESGDFPDFVSLPDRQMLNDYYERIKYPICLEDIKKLAESDAFRSVGALKKRLELLCHNTRSYNGSGSMIFRKALRCVGNIMQLIALEIPIAFVKIADQSRALELQKILKDSTAKNDL